MRIWATALGHADGTYDRLLTKLAKTHLRALDDWGLAAVDERERYELNEIMDNRYGTCSARQPPPAPAVFIGALALVSSQGRPIEVASLGVPAWCLRLQYGD